MIRNSFVSGAFVAVVLLLRPTTVEAEVTMRFPPSSIEQTERMLGADEASASPCTAMARKIVEQRGPGWIIDMSSESVSHSDEFGFIYRYRVTQNIDENGRSFSVDSIHVLWSKDCKSFMIATYPTYKLPGST